MRLGSAQAPHTMAIVWTILVLIIVAAGPAATGHGLELFVAQLLAFFFCEFRQLLYGLTVPNPFPQFR